MKFRFALYAFPPFIDARINLDHLTEHIISMTVHISGIKSATSKCYPFMNHKEAHYKLLYYYTYKYCSRQVRDIQFHNCLCYLDLILLPYTKNKLIPMRLLFSFAHQPTSYMQPMCPFEVIFASYLLRLPTVSF